jgi:hypothetical protein
MLFHEMAGVAQRIVDAGRIDLSVLWVVEEMVPAFDRNGYESLSVELRGLVVAESERNPGTVFGQADRVARLRSYTPQAVEVASLKAHYAPENQRRMTVAIMRNRVRLGWPPQTIVPHMRSLIRPHGATIRKPGGVRRGTRRVATRSAAKSGDSGKSGSTDDGGEASAGRAPQRLTSSGNRGAR